MAKNCNYRKPLSRENPSKVNKCELASDFQTNNNSPAISTRPVGNDDGSNNNDDGSNNVSRCGVSWHKQDDNNDNDVSEGVGSKPTEIITGTRIIETKKFYKREYLDVEINDHIQQKALIDSGAEVCCIANEVIQE